MSQITSRPPPTPQVSATFNAPLYGTYSHQIRENFAMVTILGTLYGTRWYSMTGSSSVALTPMHEQVFSPSCASFQSTGSQGTSRPLIPPIAFFISAVPNCIMHYFCLGGRAHRRVRRAQVSAIMLSLTILALFGSTTAYLAITVVSYQANFLQTFLWSGYELWFQGTDVGLPLSNNGAPIPLIKPSQDWPPFCARTATFTINVRLQIHFRDPFCMGWVYGHSQSTD